MRSKIFRPTNLFVSVFFIFFVVLIVFQAASAQKRFPVYITKQQPVNAVRDIPADESDIFRLINLERQKRRLNNLVWDDEVAKMARKYSEKMARESFFSHFDPQGANVAKRIKNAKIKGWSKLGENLFYVENIAKFNAFAVKGWMNSPGHRQNILDDEWTSTGVGVGVAENGDVYITQVFLKR